LERRRSFRTGETSHVTGRQPRRACASCYCALAVWRFVWGSHERRASGGIAPVCEARIFPWGEITTTRGIAETPNIPESSGLLSTLTVRSTKFRIARTTRGSLHVLNLSQVLTGPRRRRSGPQTRSDDEAIQPFRIVEEERRSMRPRAPSSRRVGSHTALLLRYRGSTTRLSLSRLAALPRIRAVCDPTRPR